jgi:translation initiation factor IF-3
MGNRMTNRVAPAERVQIPYCPPIVVKEELIGGKQKRLQLSVRISDHDYGYRMEQAKKWLAQRNTVLAMVQFKGREVTHQELGEQLLERLLTDLGKKGKPVLKNGRDLTVLITP